MSLFGSSSSSNLFGSSPFSGAGGGTSSGGSLFGSGTGSSGTSGSSGGSSLFGPSAPSSSSLFSTAGSTPSSSSGTSSLFGNLGSTSTSNSSGTSSSLFGPSSSSTSSSLFGTPSSSTTSSSLFGGSSQSNPSSGFGLNFGSGSSTTTPSNTLTTPFSTTQTTGGSTQFDMNIVNQKLEEFERNRRKLLSFYIYSKQDKIVQHPGFPKEQWEQAMKTNPDPNKLQPVLLINSKNFPRDPPQPQTTLQTGADIQDWYQYQKKLITPISFQDWQENQRKQLEEYKRSLEEAKQQIREISERQAHARRKIELLQQKHVTLRNHLLKIIIMQQQNGGVPLSLPDEIFRQPLEKMSEELNVPTQFKGRLNELSSKIRTARQLSNYPRRPEIDPKSLEDIANFLKYERDALYHISVVLNDDINVMTQMIQEILKSRNM